MKAVNKTITIARDTSAVTPRLVASLAMVLALFTNPSWGDEPVPVDKPAAVAEPTPGQPASSSAPESARKNVNLPGLVINFRQRCVDLEGSVCLDEGMLELIACTKETKEHESIVAITARPMHIHTALLLLGANNGNPAMRRPIDEQKKRWIHVPPRGDPVDVYLVFKDTDGKMVEHPISDFIARSGKRADEFAADENDAEEDIKFPNTFLFAGSLLHGDGPGPRQYLADHSGNVISIVTFGDELLCLPGVQGHTNESLMWQVDASNLPKVGSKVTLRLRPRVKPVPKTGENTRGVSFQLAVFEGSQAGSLRH